VTKPWWSRSRRSSLWLGHHSTLARCDLSFINLPDRRDHGDKSFWAPRIGLQQLCYVTIEHCLEDTGAEINKAYSLVCM
jgi:hypothetical protein